MAQLLFQRTTSGLIPACEEAREWLDKKKLGSPVFVEAKEARNAAFHRKFFALIDLAYDYWSEDAQPLEYKGEAVLPDRERFRKDITILAGFYTPVVNIKGEVRLEAESIKFSNMTEERFGELYQAVINVLLRKVFNGTHCPKWSEQELRSVAEQILDFS